MIWLLFIAAQEIVTEDLPLDHPVVVATAAMTFWTLAIVAVTTLAFVIVLWRKLSKKTVFLEQEQ